MRATKSARPLRITLIAFFRLILSLTPALDLAAQQSQDSSPPIPTIQSRTDLVLVPVVVHNKKGEHISGLTQDAFRLEENGHDQAISLFEEIRPENLATIPAAALDRGFTNLPLDEARQLRLTIVVLDLLNTSPLQRTDGRDQLIQFFSKGLVRNQPISLLCLTSKDVELVYPLTSDASQLIAALKNLDLGGPKVMPRRYAVDRTLNQLHQIAQAYAGIPGRKSLIFAAGSLPEPIVERYAVETEARQAFQSTFQALIDANIAVYPFEIMRSEVGSPSAESLIDLADTTGGSRCLESNHLPQCLAQAVEDSQGYYMLGFSVRPDDRKPGWRTLSVKVAAERVNLRARNGFYYGSIAPSTPGTAHDAEVNALASPLPYSSVPMLVRVLPPNSPATAPSLLGKRTRVEFLLTIPLSGIKLLLSGETPLNLEVGAIALTRDAREGDEFLHPVHGSPNLEIRPRGHQPSGEARSPPWDLRHPFHEP
jgi:VWFA-related protein